MVNYLSKLNLTSHNQMNYADFEVSAKMLNYFKVGKTEKQNLIKEMKNQKYVTGKTCFNSEQIQNIKDILKI